MSFISSFEIINLFVPEPCGFFCFVFWIPALIAEVADVATNGA